jgi:16S rRNA (guanine527-N7)-methyltransferase
MFDHHAQSDRLIAGASQLGIELSSIQAGQFARYAELLDEWNARLNLTRVAPEDYITLHFLDSLSLVTVIDPSSPSRSLLDVGTGAGLPGVPLKIAFPALDVTLMDSTRKRLDFLDAIVSDLGLAGTRTLHARAEEAGREPAHRERYDVVVARAVSATNVLAEWLLPLAKVGGLAVAMKSAGAEAEIASAEAAVRKVGGSMERVEKVTLPGTEIVRLLAVMRKDRPSEYQYPRPAGITKQRPL